LDNQEPAAQEIERHPLETPVAHARATDPQTSHDAAASVKHISELQLEILKAYKKKGPMRDDELCDYIRNVKKIAASESSIRSRRAELVRDSGLVKKMVDGQGKDVKTEMKTHRGGQVWRSSAEYKTEQRD
jgi:hypothetical protein